MSITEKNISLVAQWNNEKNISRYKFAINCYFIINGLIHISYSSIYYELVTNFSKFYVSSWYNWLTMSYII